MAQLPRSGIIPAVSALIFSQDALHCSTSGKLLYLMRRESNPYKGKWTFPGGKIERGETYLQATRREILEETSFIVDFPENHLLRVTDILPQQITDEKAL